MSRLGEQTFGGIRRYAYWNWPLYLFGYVGGSALLILLFALSAVRGWPGLSLLFLGALFVHLFFFAASLWAAYQQFDLPEQRAANLLFAGGRLQPTSSFVHVGLGRRETPIRLSRRLTSGHVTVVDVYNPQLAPNRALARSRPSIILRDPDPRLTWLEGAIDMIPLPDNSVTTITSARTVTELWQDGDRRLLAKEMFRITRPGGQVVILEPVRTRTQFFVSGPGAAKLQPVLYWHRVLEDCGFRIESSEDVAGLLRLIVAKKPQPGEMKQLTFDFGF